MAEEAKYRLNVGEYVLKAIRCKEGTAQVDPGCEDLTFKGLWTESYNLAFWLHSIKINRGRKIAISNYITLNYPKILLGTLLSGATAVIVDPDVPTNELESLFDNIPIDGIFSSKTQSDRFEFLIALSFDNVRYDPITATNFYKSKMFGGFKSPSEGNDSAILLKTSDQQNIVSITHSNLIASIEKLKDILLPEVDSKPSTAISMYPYHDSYGLGLLFMSLVQNTKLVLANQCDPGEFLRLIKEYKPNQLHILPSMLEALSDSSISRDHLQCVSLLYAGSPPTCPEVSLKVAMKLDAEAKFYYGFGLVESTNIFCLGEVDCTTEPPGYTKIIKDMKVKIVDNKGKEVAKGVHGRLLLQGPMVTKGYYYNFRLTKDRYQEDTWMKTGKTAYFDENDELHILDTSKEPIRMNWFTVYATELEEFIGSLVGVLDVGVVGVRHPNYNEVPRAYVVADKKNIPTEVGITAAVEERFPHYNWLRGGVKFVASLPKTRLKTLDRYKLRIIDSAYEPNNYPFKLNTNTCNLYDMLF